jgi:hypothetical protein
LSQSRNTDKVGLYLSLFNFAGSVCCGVDQSLGTDGAGLGRDVVVGVGRAGHTFFAIPDGEFIGAFGAGLSIIKGGSLGADTVSVSVLRLIRSAFLAGEGVVVPGGWRFA